MSIPRLLIVGLALGALALPSEALAEADRDEPESAEPAIYLELALADVPSKGAAAYVMPSLQQSLWLSLDTYQLVNYGLGAWTGFERKRGSAKLLPGAAMFGANAVMMVLPLGIAWEHEHWHHVALAARGIQSRVETNKVVGVTDESLAEFKRRYPAEFVRSQTIGVEGGYEFVTTLEREQFFRRTRAWNVPTIWTFYGMNSLYMQICASKLTDDDATFAAQQTDQLSRDTGGQDCTGWTYDLFHPNEPYSARGPHPAGNGIRRYRTWSELDAREKAYLSRQRTLSLLNFLDPMLLGFSDFEAKGLRFNGHVRYMPTSFGDEVSLDGFLDTRDVKLFVSVQNFFNYQHWSPGILAELWRYPILLYGNRALNASVAVNGWLQPDEQRFMTAKRELGGRGRLRLSLAGPHTFEPFVEIDGKSRGWAAGVVALEPSYSLRVGVGVPVF